MTSIIAPVWETGGRLELPPLAERASADVCVIGLGGSGLSCALELAARGLRVVGIDRGSVASGAAGGNGGFLLAGLAEFYHDAVAAIGRSRAARIYQATLEELARSAAAYPDLVRISGSLRVAADAEEARDCAAQLAALRADGLPAEPYSGPEGEGLLIPSDGTFQPLARCRSMAGQALRLGARLYEGTPALAIEPGSVTTPGGRVDCQSVVVAVDGGLEQILPELRGRVRSVRLQMLASAPTSALQVPRPVYYRWGYEYWQQLPSGAIALGGFRDQGGDQEWGAPAEPGQPIQGLLDRFLREHLRVDAPITHRWAATVGFSESVLPVIGELRPSVWVTGGYNGTGNLIGVLCGRALAERISAGRSDLLDLLAGGGEA
jgi:gamma-glutamylputrescine oxidase